MIPDKASLSSMASGVFDSFAERRIATRNGAVFVRIGGSGPAALLLHGFPQTGLMWREIAPLLAADFSVVVADLPGYGDSDSPGDQDQHASMSKRQIADTLVEVMNACGHERFAVVGHDRGGRVAYRAALDHADRITHAAMLDVIPTFEVWDRADSRLALAFWPFSLLAQPAPLPEQLVCAAPEVIVDNALTAWGSDPKAFPDWVRAAYVDALRDPDRVHTICEEYRAAAGIDREHDKSDLDADRQIRCPSLVLWSNRGGLAFWYEDAGGPLGIWRRWANDLRGHPMSAGHFFPEELPTETARHIAGFLHT